MATTQAPFYIHIYIYIYTSVLLSIYIDNVALLAISSVELGSCLGVLKTYVEIAAALSVQFEAHLATICHPLGHPFGTHMAPKTPTWRPKKSQLGLGGAQEAFSAAREAAKRPEDEPQRRPRGSKLRRRGAQEASS